MTELEIERLARDITEKLKAIARTADDPAVALATIVGVVDEMKSELHRAKEQGASSLKNWENWYTWLQTCLREGLINFEKLGK